MSLMTDLGLAVKSKLDLKQDTIIAGLNVTVSADGKTINATVPSNVSSFTNDSEFQTLTQVDTKIQNAVVGLLKVDTDFILDMGGL